MTRIILPSPEILEWAESQPKVTGPIIDLHRDGTTSFEGTSVGLKK